MNFISTNFFVYKKYLTFIRYIKFYITNNTIESKERMVNMKKMMGFMKGFLAGSLIGGAVCMMMEPPNTTKIKKAYKKTNRALKNVGYALEDLVSGK